MCGIIGYSGSQDTKEVLLKGLSQIQYRGYDSMGLVIATHGGFKRVRSVGGIEPLKKKMAHKLKNQAHGPGLAHSRWATHGAPLEKNAHPHKAGPFYIVHNGIIENAKELKAKIKTPFLSDTDSEVIAHLLWDSYKKTKDIKSAVFDTISKIKGEYSVALMSETHPKEIWAFKKGPSLLVGQAPGSALLCSDIQGILPWTNKLIFLKDGEVAHIQTQPKQKTKLKNLKNKVLIQIYSAQKKVLKKPFIFIDQTAEKDAKGPWPSYMLKEIHEQPSSVSKLIDTWIDSSKTVDGTIRPEIRSIVSEDFLDQVIKVKSLQITACGSSYYAALYGKYVIEKLSRVFVSVDVASEFRYRSPVLLNKAPLLLISQSGETADTLAVLKMAKEKLLPTLSLCNVVHSSLDRGADFKLYMKSGVEKAVASTKAFTATLTSLLLIALCLAKKNRQLLRKEEQKWVQDFLTLPDHIKELLSLSAKYKASAQKLRTLKSFIYLGRDVFYPLSLEGALKIKELTYRHATAYPAGEMKHGPLALVDKDMAIVAIAPKSSIYKKTYTNLEEVYCRGGRLIVMGTTGDKELKALAEDFISLPAVNEYLSAILCAIPLQLIAYHTALSLGHSVDQPRNLAKSVTVE